MSSILTVRNAHAMVYHTRLAKTLLFGGADDAQVCQDLWAWDGQAWSLVSATGPGPRTFPALTYAAAHNQVVLFGGNRVLFGTDDDRDTILGDGWLWDGAVWRPMPTPLPPARAEAGVAYDGHRGRVVVFGGYTVVDGVQRRLGDTWEWDGQTWRQVAGTGPSPRNSPAMTYDSQRERVVLFSGSQRPSDTWEWDGVAWRKVITEPTPGRFNAVMAYDASARRVLRFGGWDGNGRTADTWVYNGVKWRQLDVVGPTARNHAALVHDAARDRLVLFGGHDGDHVFGDTWEWDGGHWTAVTASPPRPRLDNGH